MQEELSAIDERMAAVQLEGLVDWTDDKVRGNSGAASYCMLL